MITKKIILGLLTSVLAILIYWSVDDNRAESGFRFRVVVEDGKSKTSECQKAPGFEEYLSKMNKILKKDNMVCRHINNLTTMSKGIECGPPSGGIQMLVYWAETKEECQRILNRLKNGGK